jgi:hypothetical protein
MNIDDIVRILDGIEEVVSLACRTDGRPGRNGGCLCIANPQGRVLAVFQVGSVQDDEAAKRYWTFCQEKATRLGQNPEHTSSWQTRDESVKKYGGAIRDEDGNIYSFSGLSEFLDEAVSAGAAILVSPSSMPSSMVTEIAGNSRTTLIEDFCTKVRSRSF